VAIGSHAAFEGLDKGGSGPTGEDFRERVVGEVSKDRRVDLENSLHRAARNRSFDRQIEVDAWRHPAVPTNADDPPRVDVADQHLLGLEGGQSEVETETVCRPRGLLERGPRRGIDAIFVIGGKVPQPACWRRVEVVDKHRVDPGLGGRPHHFRKLHGVVACQEKRDVEPRPASPPSIPGDEVHPLQNLRGRDATPPFRDTRFDPGDRDGEHVDSRGDDPLAVLIEKLAVAGDADSAAGGVSVNHHPLQPGMQKLFPPTLETDVLRHNEIWAEHLPRLPREISVQ